MQFRPNTLDAAIFHKVVSENEYQLPEQFLPTDIIIDIGTHIGAFAIAALNRGAQSLYCIEASVDNFQIAQHHLEMDIHANRVTLKQAAAWRSDENEDQLYFSGYPNLKGFPGFEHLTNTGGGNVLTAKQGLAIPKIPLDQLIQELTQGKQRIRLIKLDCEGSEWPILLTAKRLDLVDEIIGEYHEMGGDFIEFFANGSSSLQELGFNDQSFTEQTLKQFFEAQGFQITTTRHLRPNGEQEGAGLFRAWRNS